MVFQATGHPGEKEGDSNKEGGRAQSLARAGLKTTARRESGPRWADTLSGGGPTTRAPKWQEFTGQSTGREGTEGRGKQTPTETP